MLDSIYDLTCILNVYTQYIGIYRWIGVTFKVIQKKVQFSTAKGANKTQKYHNVSECTKTTYECLSGKFLCTNYEIV